MNEKSLLLVHGHRFPTVDGVALDDGKFGDLKNYSSLFDSVTMVARSRLAEDNERRDLNTLAQASIGFESHSHKRMFANRFERERFCGLIDESDAVIVRLPSVLGILAAARARRLRKPVYVEMVGCPWGVYSHHGFAGKVLAPVVYLATRRQVKLADFVLYVTQQFLQRRYPTRGQSEACTDVVLGTHDAAVLERRIDRIRSRPDGSPLILGTVAAVDIPYKGHEYVLRAVAQLKAPPESIQYWIIGGGAQSRLQGLVARLGLTNHVRFVGALTRGQVLRTLENNIDLYVQPSLEEGLPRAVLEAMSVGCPTIGSRVGGIPELLRGEDTFPAGKVKSLARLLSSLDNGRLQSMAARNFNFVAEQYKSDVLNVKRMNFMRRFRDAIDQNL